MELHMVNVREIGPHSAWVECADNLKHLARCVLRWLTGSTLGNVNTVTEDRPGRKYVGKMSYFENEDLCFRTSISNIYTGVTIWLHDMN